MALISQGLLTDDLILQGYIPGEIIPPVELPGNIIIQGLGSRSLITQGYGSNGAIASEFIINNPNVFHVSRWGSDKQWVIVKRSSEAIPIDFDLSAVLPTGIIVQSVISIAATPITAPALTCASVIVSDKTTYYRDSNTKVMSGRVVQFTASGGLPSTSGQEAFLNPLEIHLKYVSSDGARREAIGFLAVIDSPGAAYEVLGN